MSSPFEVSRNVPRWLATKLKKQNGHKLVITRSSPRKAVWNFPTEIPHQLAHLIFLSVLNRQISPAIMGKNLELVLVGLFDLANHGLIRALVEQFISRENSEIHQAVRVASGLSFAYGINSSRGICISFYSYIEEHFGLHKTALSHFMLENNRLDVSRIFSVFQQLEDKWNNLFRLTISHNCPFCHEDVSQLQPLPLRFEQLHSMHCCNFLAHKACFRDFFSPPEGYHECPVCHTPYYRRQIDDSLDVLHHVFTRNRLRLQNNRSVNRNLVLGPTSQYRIGSFENYIIQLTEAQTSEEHNTE